MPDSTQEHIRQIREGIVGMIQHHRAELQRYERMLREMQIDDSQGEPPSPPAGRTLPERRSGRGSKVDLVLSAIRDEYKTFEQLCEEVPLKETEIRNALSTKRVRTRIKRKRIAGRAAYKWPYETSMDGPTAAERSGSGGDAA